jgi:ATP-binding cassette subfamily B protein
MINSIKELISICSPKKKGFILSVLLGLLSVLFSIVPYYMIYRTVIVLYQGNSDTNIFILLIFISLILRFSFFALSSYISHSTTADLLRDIRMEIIEKLNKLSLGKAQEYDSGHYKKLLVDDVESLEKFMAHSIPEVTASIGVSFFTGILLIVLDTRLGISILIVIPIAYKILSGMMIGCEEKMENYGNSLIEMNMSLIEYIQGMQVIRTFNKTSTASNKLSSSIDNFRFYVLDWYKGCWKYMTGFNVLLKGNLLILIPVSGLLYLNGSVTVSKIVFFILMSFSFFVPLTKLGEFSDTFPMIQQSYFSIQEFLSSDEMKYENEEVTLNNYSISFENVSFSYIEGIKALDNISFTAKEKQLTALVGASGCGKSTIGKLSARFWDVDQGNIYIGNININKIPMKQLMNSISFVFQDTVILKDSIRNNIRMGKPDASDEEILRAAKLASCDTIIYKKGLDSIVGGLNMSLSGGEKQRIAIARAILKNAPIIILDEATASSDSENQMEIQRAISNLSKNKTVLTIAHRLSTITDADQIITLDKGSISEKGNHDVLLNSNGKYKELYDKYQRSHGYNSTHGEVM